MGLQILVWHEDRDHRPLRALLERTFTYEVTFEVWNDPIANRIRAGNAWRASKRTDLQVTLRKRLADHLLKPNGVVLFHYDGDVRWSDTANCETRAQFEALVRKQVVDLLSQRHSADEVRDRLREVVPHYSLEAWLYQSTDVAKQLCAKHHGSRHVEEWDVFARDPGAIDDIERPKEVACVRDKHNVELAHDFPVARAISARASYFAFVGALSASEVLRPFLRPAVLAAISKAGRG